MTLERGRAVLTLDERLTNEAGEPLDIMWGHHVAFGLPFLEQGAAITTSAQTLIVHEELAGFEPRLLQVGQQARWPHAQSAAGSTVDMSAVPPRAQASGREMAYLTDFDGPAWYAIMNRDQGAGFAMRWEGEVFRYLWLWQEFAYAGGYPWWGRTYTMALEPWTSYPTNGLAQAVENGTALLLQPNETVETRLCAVAFDGIESVSKITAAGEVEGEQQHGT